MRRFLPALFLLCLPAVAQPPAPPNPAAPTLNPVPNVGAQRGATVELALTGTNLVDPVGVWTSFPAKVTIPTEAMNGKAPTTFKAKLEIPKDAPLGFHFVRVATKRGMSNARLFCIDDLPQVAEAPGNRELAKAQAVPVPSVVCGRMDAETTAYYKVAAKAGQRLSFEVLGRRLGSAFDPQITLYDAKGGEVTGGHSNDAPGCQTDPRLTMTFKDAGDYVVGIRDVSYRGGADFFYRLRIGDFPCATTPLPMGIKRGTRAKIAFAGPNVEGVAAVDVQAPAEGDSMQVAPVGPSGLHGWPVLLAVSDLEEALEKEPNDEPAKANRIAVPGAITGRFEKKDDLDHFVFAAKKGQRLIIEAHAPDWLSPTDVTMALKDAKGAQLQATNPAAAPRLDFTPAADGDYTLAVEHLHSWGGPDEAYRITVTPFAPDFSLTLAIDRFDVAPGGELSIPVYMQQAGYAGAVELSVEGNPGVTGKATIPAGPPKPPNVPAATLQVKAGEIPSGPLSIRIAGKATINGAVVTRYASTRALLGTAMGNLPVTPREQWPRVGLAITEKPPFALAARAEGATFPPGKPAMVEVTITRAGDFKGEVALAAVAPIPPGITFPGAKIAAGAASVKAQVGIAPTVKDGPATLLLQGTATHAGRPWVVRPSPLVLSVFAPPPFSLTAKADTPTVAPGKPATVDVAIARVGDFKGEVNLALAAPIPAGFVLPPVKIAAGASSAKATLTVPPTAAVGSAMLVLQGTATHAGRVYTVKAAPVVLTIKK
ncbi:MAG: hypothetical protein K2W96_20365 [Gemmataceae bacterium]|nr:hypothetical protein [Gemmataceae bacterium]